MNYKKGSVRIAMSIVIAGLIVAGSILLTRNSSNSVANSGNHNGGSASVVLKDFREVQKDDHIKGNPDAKVTIVEFSDFECPFCARLHPTLTRLIEERDDIKWIYRHFPLSSHSRALGAAIASECIAELSDNESFWKFANSLFTNQRSLGQNLYNNEASRLGIDIGDFESCMGSKEIAQNVRDDLNEATNAGGRGTPFSVVIGADGELTPFSGALSYESIVSLIEKSL